MDEYVITIVGDLELSRRFLLKQLAEAQERIAELEAKLGENNPDD